MKYPNRITMGNRSPPVHCAVEKKGYFDHGETVRAQRPIPKIKEI